MKIKKKISKKENEERLNILEDSNLEKEIFNIINKHKLAKFIKNRYKENKFFIKGILTYYFLEYCDYVIIKYGKLDKTTVNKNDDYFKTKMKNFTQAEAKIQKFSPCTNMLFYLFVNLFIDDDDLNLVKNRVFMSMLFFDYMVSTDILHRLNTSKYSDEEISNTFIYIYNSYIDFLEKNEFDFDFTTIKGIVVFYYLTKTYFYNVSNNLDKYYVGGIYNA